MLLSSRAVVIVRHDSQVSTPAFYAAEAASATISILSSVFFKKISVFLDAATCDFYNPEQSVVLYA